MLRPVALQLYEGASVFESRINREGQIICGSLDKFWCRIMWEDLLREGLVGLKERRIRDYRIEGSMTGISDCRWNERENWQCQRLTISF